jgi:hypothetical protein
MRRNRVLITVDRVLIHTFVEDIDMRLVELSRTDFTFEEQIELSECASFGFGNAEIGVDDAQEAKTSPEECSVVLRN